MKAVILAGGLGTRIAEETAVRPKPMVDIGGKPILWHIMKLYSSVGINDFVICLGYRGYMIKEYFANYFLHTSDVTFDIRKNRMEVHQNSADPWSVTLVDTGELTMTGGRLKRIAPYVGDSDFCMTYGDGLTDLPIHEVIKFHRERGMLATMTAIRPPGRFGAIDFDGDRVTGFREKPVGDGGWINGGFFVLSPKVLDLVDDDDTVWEREPLERLVAAGQLASYRHDGFWQCMDTQRDRTLLESLWAEGKAPWKVW